MDKVVMVIFKENGMYKMTSLENYESRIRNANQVGSFRDCNSFEDCVACLPKSAHITYIDKTGE